MTEYRQDTNWMKKSRVNFKNKIAGIFTSKMSYLGIAEELQFEKCKLWWTISKSKETKGRSAFTEKTEESFVLKKNLLKKNKFKVVVDSHWLQKMVSELLLRQGRIFFLFLKNGKWGVPTVIQWDCCVFRALGRRFNLQPGTVD